MTMPLHHPEIDRLTSAVLDDTISDKDFRRLDQILCRSAENRSRYLEIIRLESLLHWEAGETATNVDLSPEQNKIISLPIFTWASSIAAIFLALAGSWWAFYIINLGHHSGDLTASQNKHSSSGPSYLRNNVQEFTGSENALNFALANKGFAIEEAPRRTAARIASRGMEILASGVEHSRDGVTEYHGSVKRWNRVPFLATPSEKGILPFSGSSMIALKPMFLDMESQFAQVVETIQVLDVRDALKISNEQNQKARLSASIKFNQSFGECKDSTEYGLTLSAYRGKVANEETSLVHVEKSLIGDLDPSTWSEVVSQMEIPQDTEFVVVSLSARKSGPDALLANTSSYYSDDLKLSLSLGEKYEFQPI